MKTKLIVLTIVLAFASLYAAGTLYSGMNDKTEQFSQDQSNTFSAGYINAAKQKTDSIIQQLNPNKSLMERLTDYVKGKVADKVTEASNDKVAPELKHKTSPAASETPRASTATTNNIGGVESVAIDGDSAPANINIGSGTDQSYSYTKFEYTNGKNFGPSRQVHDVSKNMVSEVIDGKRYIYAGFDNFGTTLENAIATAANGDTIIVKDGTYTFGRNSSWTVSAKDFNIFGGYSSAGTRDIVNNKTIITGNLPVYNTNNMEINGCTLNGTLQFFNSSGVTLRNNTFTQSSAAYTNQIYAISLRNSNIAVSNNTFDTWVGIKRSDINFENGRWTTGMGWDSSVIVSRNNNYYGNWAIATCANDWRSDPTSKGDYFRLSNSEGSINYDSHDAISFDALDMKNSANSFLPSPSKPTPTPLTPPAYSSMNPYNIYQPRESESNLLYNALTYSGNMENAAVSSIFKSLLANKGSVVSASGGVGIDKAALERMVSNALTSSALSMPLGSVIDANSPEMMTALTLANILANPTEDQKMILDTVTALLKDVSNMQDQAANPELAKSSDELIQAAAAVLIAQAIPDLLKEGDISNIKSTFTDLGKTKTRILNDYNESTKPYYDKVKDAISRNITALTSNNILSNSVTSKEIEDMPRNELDKIIDKLKKLEKKSFEAEYILQEEAKARSKYVDPNKKMLEDNMKAMMKDFTQRLSKVLESTTSAKK